MLVLTVGYIIWLLQKCTVYLSWRSTHTLIWLTFSFGCFIWHVGYPTRDGTCLLTIPSPSHPYPQSPEKSLADEVFSWNVNGSLCLLWACSWSKDVINSDPDFLQDYFMGSVVYCLLLHIGYHMRSCCPTSIRKNDNQVVSTCSIKVLPKKCSLH